MTDLSNARPESNALQEEDSILGQIADEFLQRLNRGEDARIEEYVARYPHLAAVLGQVLPALQAIRHYPPEAVAASDGSSVEGPVSGTLGDFRIFQEIGRGGMGIVYEAEQISLGRRVALKVLPFAAAMDPRQLQRFKNEAQAAAHLQHTNIVPVHYVGCERGVHFYAMQYIEGQTLAAIIRELRALAGSEIARPTASEEASCLASELASGRWAPLKRPGADEVVQPCGGEQPTGPYPVAALPHHLTTSPPHDPTPAVGALSTQLSTKSPGFFRSVAHLGVQAAEALEHAHQAGIIHRDIKPGNLLVEDGGRLWVADFGLAKLGSTAGLTLSGDLVGTLRYMSPEQALAKRVTVDARTDVYSLGVTLYELLALEPAYNGRNREEVLRQIAFEEPRPPSRWNKAVPAELETIVLKAMAKSPEERYASAQELADDLQRFLEDKPIKAKRPTLSQRAAKWARRHKPIVRAGLAVLVLAMLALATSTIMIWRSLERERQVSYIQRVNLAEREWSGNNMKRMDELLDECPEDLRGWEWHYLKRRQLPSLPPLRHASAPMAVVFSPDGQWIASAGRDGTVRVWNGATGKEAACFTAHEGLLRSVVFSPDGRRLVTGGSDGNVRIWGFEPSLAEMGKSPFQTLWNDPSAEVRGMAFRPDGRRLACAIGRTGGNGEVMIFDADSGQEVVCLRGHAGAVNRVAFSPDGRHVASASADTTVKIWDAANGREFLTFRGHSRAVNSVAYSPDGKRLASATTDWPNKDNGELKVWNARTSQEVLNLRGHVGWIYAVAFSPDGRRLASSGLDGSLKLWDPTTGQEALTLRGHQGCVSSVAFSGDGNRLVSGCTDQTIRVWDARPLAKEEAGESVLTLRGHQGSVRAVAFHPSGRYLVSGGDDQMIRIWDLVRARAGQGNEPAKFLAGGHTGIVTNLAFHPDGQLLASAGASGPDGQALRVWDATTWRERYALPDVGAVVAFSPNGQYLAAVNAKYEVAILDAQTGRRMHSLPGNTWFIHDLAFSPDSRLIASASNDCNVRIWDVTTGKGVSAPMWHSGLVYCLAFSRDGRFLASGGLDRTVKVWDPRSSQVLHDLPDPSEGVQSVAFHPTDSRVLAWGGTDATVKVWDAVTREVHKLRGHTSWVEGVAFSPDGQWIASGSLDGTVKVWRVPSLGLDQPPRRSVP